MRQMYKRKEQFPRLYIQEGKRKRKRHASTVSLHSGQRHPEPGDRALPPEDLVKIITVCGVKEVAFIFDADWNDLSNNIKFNTPSIHALGVSSAARNFKKYAYAEEPRHHGGKYSCGHINKNDEGDKGLDDLLADKLAGHEEELAEDLEFACNEKSGM